MIRLSGRVNPESRFIRTSGAPGAYDIRCFLNLQIQACNTIEQKTTGVIVGFAALFYGQAACSDKARVLRAWMAIMPGRISH